MWESLLGGGITGLIGTLLSNITDLWKAHQDRKHEVEMRKLDIQIMDKEHDYAVKLENVKTEGEIRTGELDLRERSYEFDAATYAKDMRIKAWWLKMLMVFVDFIRGLVRPALTLFLIYLTYKVYQQATMVLELAGEENLSADKAHATYEYIVNMILYLTAVCVTWWFGTRPKKNKKI